MPGIRLTVATMGHTEDRVPTLAANSEALGLVVADLGSRTDSISPSHPINTFSLAIVEVAIPPFITTVVREGANSLVGGPFELMIDCVKALLITEVVTGPKTISGTYHVAHRVAGMPMIISHRHHQPTSCTMTSNSSPSAPPLLKNTMSGRTSSVPMRGIVAIPIGRTWPRTSITVSGATLFRLEEDTAFEEAGAGADPDRIATATVAGDLSKEPGEGSERLGPVNV